MAFYRVTQEVLNNAAKHAEATRIKISLTYAIDGATLHIDDDGRGFDPRMVANDHLGLRIMAERAATIGGDLEIISNPGQGTQIGLTWPNSDEQTNHD